MSEVRRQRSEDGSRKNLTSVFCHLISVLRYRFFIFAGLLPYLLGASIAYGSEEVFKPSFFLIGLLGIFFACVGVETFNEYFDAREGGDRVFIVDRAEEANSAVFWLGVSSFALAFMLAIYLTWKCGYPVMLFAIAGFLAAVFYAGPPLRLSHRGFGEAAIALAYGPFMVLGSYYLQTQSLNVIPLLASIVPALLLFSLALINEVPDYYGDRLVGKRNIVVRFGRQKTVTFYQVLLFLSFAVAAVGLVANKFPPLLLLIIPVVPLAWRSSSVARRNCNFPAKFIPAIRGTITVYLSIMCLMIISFLFS